MPAFPLQLLLQRNRDWKNYPAAVVAEDKPQGKILWVNRAARRAGVVPGLRYAAGSSLAPDLRAGVVAPAEIEREADRLAARFTSFTPHVEPSREEPGVFWLGGAGLSRLYQSAKKWAAALGAEIEAQRFAGNVAVGYTRFGTYAAAKVNAGTIVFTAPSEERSAARAALLEDLDIAPELRDALFKLGIKTVGALLDLPPGGLYERFGPGAHRLYRMASGDLWQPFRPRAPDEPVRERLFLDDAESDRVRLLFLLKRMLHPMLAALAARGAALAEIKMRFVIDRSGAREERVRPAAATLDAAQLLDLMRLRLETLEIAAGIAEIELVAEAVPATPEQLRFFAAHPGRDLAAADRALARLRAEFGAGAVVCAKLGDGHLPEARFFWEPLDRVAPPRPGAPPGKNLIRRIMAKPVRLPAQSQTAHDGWLVLGLKYGAVERLSGPYIFSGGWWNREIRREYYFAETRKGDLLWIYYDRVRRKWFLQGWVE